MENWKTMHELEDKKRKFDEKVEESREEAEAMMKKLKQDVEKSDFKEDEKVKELMKLGGSYNVYRQTKGASSLWPVFH